MGFAVMKEPKSVTRALKSRRTQAKNLVMMFLTSKLSRTSKGAAAFFLGKASLMRKVNATVPRGPAYKRMVSKGLIKNKWGYYDD